MIKENTKAPNFNLPSTTRPLLFESDPKYRQIKPHHRTFPQKDLSIQSQFSKFMALG